MAGLTGAIQALVAHRDALFLKRLAEDYKLDLAELTSKYLEAPAPVEKKKRQIKVKVSADGKEIRCQGQTAKKEQCSFQPLAGKCFCKRHLPADLPAPAPASEPEDPQLEFGLPTIPEEEPKSAAERLQDMLDSLGSDSDSETEDPSAKEYGEPVYSEEDLRGPAAPAPVPETPMAEVWAGLSPLAPLKSLPPSPETAEKSPCNLWAKHFEQQEAEQEQMLESLRQQELMEQMGHPEIDTSVPYEPPVASPSPPKVPAKRRQSIRPKVAKKKQ